MRGNWRHRGATARNALRRHFVPRRQAGRAVVGVRPSEAIAGAPVPRGHPGLGAVIDAARRSAKASGIVPERGDNVGGSRWLESLRSGPRQSSSRGCRPVPPPARVAVRPAKNDLLRNLNRPARCRRLHRRVGTWRARSVRGRRSSRGKGVRGVVHGSTPRMGRSTRARTGRQRRPCQSGSRASRWRSSAREQVPDGSVTIVRRPTSWVNCISAAGFPARARSRADGAFRGLVR